MKLTPDEKRRIYEEEKTRLEAQEKAKSELRAEKRRKGCLGCLGVIVLVFLISIVGNLSDSSRSKSTRRTGSANGGSIGSQARIYRSGLETIFLATNREHFDLLIEASKADDSYYRILVLVGSGNVFSVPNNTKVQVLDWDHLKIKATKVRIIEGSHDGRVVWVPYEWVK